MPEELPDLETDEIGWIAYWNALENGAVASDIEPDVIANNVGNLTSFDAYANGFDADYTLSREDGDVTINTRIKTDGWVITWFDNNELFYDDDPEVYRGLSDIFADWTVFDVPDEESFGSDETSLSRVIEEIAEEIDSGLFSHGDEGFYHYNYPDASELIVLYGEGEDGDTLQYYFDGESSDIEAYHTAGAIKGVNQSPSMFFEDETIIDSDTEDESIPGLLDVLDSDITLSPGEYYSVEIDAYNRHGKVAHIFLV